MSFEVIRGKNPQSRRVASVAVYHRTREKASGEIVNEFRISVGFCDQVREFLGVEAGGLVALAVGRGDDAGRYALCQSPTGTAVECPRGCRWFRVMRQTDLYEEPHPARTLVVDRFDRERRMVYLRDPEVTS